MPGTYFIWTCDLLPNIISPKVSWPPESILLSTLVILKITTADPKVIFQQNISHVLDTPSILLRVWSGGDTVSGPAKLGKRTCCFDAPSCILQ